MNQAHLSTERLQSIHDETSSSAAELRHLASCSSCQQLLDDARWTQLLARMRPDQPAEGAHPGGDELLAYQTGALSGPRQAQVRAHLGGCPSCMVAYARLREELKGQGYPAPSAAKLRGVIGRFQPRAVKRLGKLLISRLGGRLALQFQAAPGLDPGLCTTAGPPSRRKPHPRRRIAECEIPAAYESLWSQLENRLDSEDEAAWGLRVSTLPGRPHDDLQVTLLPIGTVESAREVKIRLVPEDGNESVSETDEDGVAVLACPKGRSRLIVEVDLPLVIEVCFDS